MPDNIEDLAGLVGIGLLGVIGYSLISNQIYQHPVATVLVPKPKPATTAPAASSSGTPTPALLGLKATGQKVAMVKGGDPAGAGQRYNINHKFKNYCMIGYFKTGKGQKIIELKTDGPNHGGCKTLPMCCWLESDIDLATGQARFTSEWPHPKNHGDAPCPMCKALGAITGEVGYAVVAYQTGEFRTVEQWLDIGVKGKWVMAGKITDTGQVTSPELAKRDPGGALMAKYENGMEAEVRMHGATSGDTAMRDCNVWEIQPRTTATAAFTNIRWYK